MPGIYTLMLSADDGVQAVPYDAMIVTVALTPKGSKWGNNIELAFPSATGRQYRIQKSTDLVAWMDIGNNLAGNGSTLQFMDIGALQNPNKKRFCRVLLVE